VLDTGEDLNVVFDFVGDEDVFGFATLFEGERTVGFGTGEEDGFCMKVFRLSWVREWEWKVRTLAGLEVFFGESGWVGDSSFIGT
jgi:hypothetical protein